MDPTPPVPLTVTFPVSVEVICPLLEIHMPTLLVLDEPLPPVPVTVTFPPPDVILLKNKDPE